MPPLDLRGFSTPADDMSGLTQLGNHMERNRRYDAEQQRQQRAQTTASSKFLTDYLDPSQHLTGSLYDPEITTAYSGLLSDGMQLASKGADIPTIQMALGPKMQKMMEYEQKAKLLTEQGKQFQGLIKGVKGIDTEKAMAAYKDAAFFDVDPQTGQKKLRDISQIDPERNYGDDVMRNGDIYNNEGLGDWVKGLKQNKVTSDVRLYDSKGNLRRTKAELSAPQGFVPETDARGAHTGFVPDYEVATDDGNPLIHEFETEKGKVKAPVRMVKDDVFSSIAPSGKAYLLQEAKKYAKAHGVDPGSKSVENFAKVLAYDELKNSGKYASTISELSDNKPSTIQLKINNGIPLYKQGKGSGANGEVTINDVYGEIDDAASDIKSKGYEYLRTNALSSDAQDAVLESARKATGVPSVGIGDLKIIKGDDGKIGVYAAKDIENPMTLTTVVKEGTLVRTLSKVGVNRGKQAGAKAKQAVVNEGNTAPKKEKISW